MEDGQIEAHRRGRSRPLPAPLREAFQAAEEELVVICWHVSRVDCVNSNEPPRLGPLEIQPQQRAAQKVEGSLGKLVKGRIVRLAGVDVDAESIHRAGQIWNPPEDAAQLADVISDEILAIELDDGSDVRANAIAAGLGKERDIVACAEIGKVAAQVHDVVAPGPRRRVRRHILVRGDDASARIRPAEIASLLDDDNMRGHGSAIQLRLRYNDRRRLAAASVAAHAFEFAPADGQFGRGTARRR